MKSDLFGQRMRSDPAQIERVRGWATAALDLGPDTPNRILTEQHGKRIAVIENELGEVGVDQELVLGAEEDVFELNKGCRRVMACNI